jgi:hypothetical protein
VPIFQCPTCATKSEAPARLVGKRVRCKNCGNEFVCGARTAGQGAITVAPQAVKTAAQGGPSYPVVVAHRRDEESPGGGGYRWLLAALAAFLLPVLAAGAFVGLKWNPAKPAAPAGELYAGVEVGSSSVTYTVFDVFTQAEQGYDYRILLTDSKKTGIQTGMEKTGKLDPAGLRKTIEAVRECYEKLTEVDKIPSSRVFIVGSDGLMGAIRNRRDLSAARKDKLIGENQKELARAVKKDVGKTMTFMDPEEKAVFEFEAVVEPGRDGSAVYLKVGTGATRGFYREPGGGIQKVRVAGIGEFLGRAGRGVFGPGAARLGESLIRRPFRAQVKKAPEFGRRQDVYLVGGIVWALCTCLHTKEQVAPPEAGLYVSLSAEDIDTFVADVRKGKDFLQAYRPPVGLSAEEKARVQKEIKRVQKQFPPDKLAAGAEVLAALAAEMKLESKNLRFRRDAHIAWLMAYIAKYAGLKR